MHNRKKRLLLLTVILLFVISGCGNNNNANQSTTNNTQNTGENNNTGENQNTPQEVQKPQKIVAMLDIFAVTEENGRQQIIDKYKELTGIDLIVNQPPHNQYYEKVNLAFASGDIPDVIELAPSDNSAFLTYSTQGALADITDLVEASDTLMTANQKILDGMRVDGRLYGYPEDIGNGAVTIVRQDWLDNLGMSAPTNYAEYLDMLRAFTFNDPDGNGVNDTKGFTGAGLDNITDNYRYILDFMQDAVPGFVKKNDVWVDGFQEPEMVQAMQRIKAAYEEGLIDKDIITNKTSTAREKFQNGEAGVINYWAGQWNENLSSKTKQVNPKAKVVTIPAIDEVTYINRVPSTHCITSAADNVDGIFKYFIEYMHDGAEGQNLFTYGVEGLTYDIVDGKGQWRNMLADTSSKYSKVVLNPFINIVPFKEELFEVPELLRDSDEKFQAKMVQAEIPLLTDTYIKMNADIIQERSSTFSKIMLGEVSIEDGLAAYSKKVNNELKMQTILQEMNAK